MTQDKDWQEEPEPDVPPEEKYPDEFGNNGGSGPPDASDPPKPDVIGGGPEGCRE